jgi:hypothetical protein
VLTRHARILARTQAESTAASLVEMGFPQRARVEARFAHAFCLFSDFSLRRLR